jgi:hypothetical protein
MDHVLKSIEEAVCNLEAAYWSAHCDSEASGNALELLAILNGLHGIVERTNYDYKDCLRLLQQSHHDKGDS